MTKEELAGLLNGREYGREITREEERLARENNLFVAFGASDDLLAFRGAIDDAVEAFDGGVAYVTPNGLVKNWCADDDCPYCKKLIATAKTVNTIWNKDGYSWWITTTLPYAPFDIMEGGEKYCRGIVVEMPL